MELIDDEGRLFGRVNVIDALVVLLIAAVVVAGAAFVLTDDPAPPPETDTTYATLDVGTVSPYVVDAIEEGDAYDSDSTSTLRITDVHLTPQDGQTRVVLRVALEGERNEQGSLTYAGAPPRLGRTLDITTDRYQVNGQIRDVGDSDALATEQQRVLLSSQVDAGTAQAVTPGDEIRLSDRTVARINNVTTYTTNRSTQRQLFVEATLAGHRQQDRLRFGGSPVRRGQSVTLPTNKYTLDARIEQVSHDIDMDATTTRTVTLRMEEVREDFADAIEPGMVERTGDTTVARVTGVETEPSLIITTGENGSVNVVDHPVNREVTITADLQLREMPSGLAFKGDQIRQGSTVALDLGTVTVEATVVTVGR
ncbi:DUF4330 family protein [Halorubrum ezzemoulense]|uniref:DUF4330 family protein n=1 Tax=Halorubrum TaxID=56688 RepID=UPI0010F8759D|nr:MULTISPECIES: DUF4330 family protein [Halorubrum]MDB2273911.1 DUF4330 family protein [Halorubrum ezzemoulense]MDB9300361.1 DUF4330 family protein [Halorubrum ezzemoulense]TKX41298.1 DUF4330 family protein [Halorubrum sp. CGM4_25_10-8A]TKX63927.1 DUF4330 family protein [Halorubrum sp. GN12_10-3_MGM]